MIISCPACATRYVVPDNAIGVEGRTVRCAKCHHSWFQEGPELTPPTVAAAAQDATASTPVAVPPTPAQEAPAPAAPPPAQDAPPVSEPQASPRTQATVTEAASGGLVNETVSQFDHGPPFRPRRHRLRLWTAGAVLFALAAGGIIAAVSYRGLPDWVPVNRPVFAQAKPDLRLEFPPQKQDRRTLPNGTEFFGASGVVTNIGTTVQTVPPILIVLRDGQERIVYSWEVPPPKSKLAPGESVTINEAVTDVPRSAKFAEIGWKPS